MAHVRGRIPGRDLTASISPGAWRRRPRRRACGSFRGDPADLHRQQGESIPAAMIFREAGAVWHTYAAMGGAVICRRVFFRAQGVDGPGAGRAEVSAGILQIFTGSKANRSRRPLSSGKLAPYGARTLSWAAPGSHGGYFPWCMA